MSSSATTVIGFSLTGSTIPAGEGVLLVLSVEGDTDAVCLTDLIVSDSSGGALVTSNDCTSFTIDAIESCDDPDACNTGDDGACEYPADNYDCDGNCTVDIDCNGDCGGDAVVDECGVCDGPGLVECWDGSFECNASDCPDQPTELVDIYFTSDTDIAGFQFNLDNVVVLGAAGGAAEEAGFQLSTSTTTVLGFSLTGGTIAAGEGLLVQVEVEGGAADACLSGLVFSDASGTALPADVADCTTVVIDAIDDNVYGCTDSDACNYNDDATADDGSCDSVSYTHLTLPTKA